MVVLCIIYSCLFFGILEVINDITGTILLFACRTHLNLTRGMDEYNFLKCVFIFMEMRIQNVIGLFIVT
jgi:hypothetical protein